MASKKTYIEVAELLQRDADAYRANLLDTNRGVSFNRTERAKNKAKIDALKAVAIGMADIFRADNERFDRERFMEATSLVDPFSEWQDNAFWERYDPTGKKRGVK